MGRGQAGDDNWDIWSILDGKDLQSISLARQGAALMRIFCLNGALSVKISEDKVSLLLLYVLYNL